VWTVLPIVCGSAISEALSSWSTGPARAAAVLLWAAWAAGLFVLFAPRPWGYTLLRVVAPIGVAITIVSASSTNAGSATLAIVSSLVASALALSAPVCVAAANALAYGEERRYPMRAPTPLLLAPIPIAIAIVGAGLATGPLLLADGRVVAGLIAVVVGIPLALLVLRSLDALSHRWVVLVPAGLALVDELTLLDPVLVKRQAIARIKRATGSAPRTPTVLDLRLGTAIGGVDITMASSVTFGRRRGRSEGVIVEPDAVLVSIVSRDAFLAQASDHKIKVR
jgi:hypothetical protein